LKRCIEGSRPLFDFDQRNQLPIFQALDLVGDEGWRRRSSWSAIKTSRTVNKNPGDFAAVRPSPGERLRRQWTHGGRDCLLQPTGSRRDAMRRWKRFARPGDRGFARDRASSGRSQPADSSFRGCRSCRHRAGIACRGRRRTTSTCGRTRSGTGGLGSFAYLRRRAVADATKLVHQELVRREEVLAGVGQFAPDFLADHRHGFRPASG